MKGKVTEELLGKMIEARKTGKTYKDIEAEYNVSRWVTLHYLKGISRDESMAEQLWQKAEKKAESILKERGFENILNLNRICPQSFFDYYGTLKGQGWLVDVTINESKDLANKALRLVNGFHCAVLYISHDLEKYRFVKLQEV